MGKVTGFMEIDRADRRILAILSHPGLVRMGLYSFSIYLWQQPLIRLSEKGHVWLALICLAVCSAASFYLVEQPARRFLNKRWTKKTPATTPATPSMAATSLASPLVINEGA